MVETTEEAVGQEVAQPRSVQPRRVRFSREVALYIVRGIVSHSLVAFFILEAVFATILTVRVTEKVPLGFVTIAPVILSALGEALIYTVPTALLFGSGLVAGRLRGDRELLALSSFGFSPAQLLAAVALLGIVLSALAYEVNQRWVPRFRDNNRNLTGYVLRQLPRMGEGWNLHYETDEYVFWVHHHRGGLLQNIFLTLRPGGRGGPVSAKTLDRVDSPTYPIYLFADRAVALSGSGDKNEFQIRFEDLSVFVDDKFFDSSSRDSDAGADPNAAAADSSESAASGGEIQPASAKTEDDELSGTLASRVDANETPADHDPYPFFQRGDLSSWKWSIPTTQKAPRAKEMDRWALLEARPGLLANWRRLEAQEDPDAKRAARAYHANVAEPHRRLATALSCLTFPLAAFAIGLVLRSSNRLLPFFVSSTTVPAIFFSLHLVGVHLAEEGKMPWLSHQMGNIALFLLVAVCWCLASPGLLGSLISCWRRRDETA